VKKIASDGARGYSVAFPFRSIVPREVEMSKKVEAFVERLASVKLESARLFNPWRDHDKDYDLSKDAPRLRRENLVRFLSSRQGKARIILIGEAAGYQGAKFSGIAMLSERILCGRRVPDFPRDGYHPRTSCPNGPNISDTVRQYGFNEPTATVVWEAVLENRLDPLSVVTWNIFPFHPRHDEQPHDALSNRTPTPEEIRTHERFCDELIGLFPGAVVLAVGEKAGRYLAMPRQKILRHPANGGAEKFRKEFGKRGKW